MQFTKAVKHEAKLRMALIGPAGSGKTMTALKIAQHLGTRIAVMDTEHGSAAKYADLFEFDTFTPDTFSPQTYIDAIDAAGAAGYDVLILDSLSHAWSGKEGALEQVDKITKRSQSGNSYMAWRDVTPLHNKMIDAILAAKVHVIATMRTKTEYVMETNEKGKVVPKKVGLQPVQRDGMEYEFDVIADLDADNNLIIGKTRCPQLHGQMFAKAGQDVADVLTAWLTGAPMPELPAPKATPLPATNGGGKAALPKRPWEPDVLRDYMLRKVTDYTGKVQNVEGHIKATLASLHKIALEDPDRHTITLYLFGVESSKDLTEAQRSALLDWIGANEANEYQPSPTSVDEAQRIIRVWREEHGQLTLLNDLVNEGTVAE